MRHSSEGLAASSAVSHAALQLLCSLNAWCLEGCSMLCSKLQGFEEALNLCWLVQGPEVGEVLMMLEMEDDDLQPGSGFVPLSQRIERLKTWLA